MSRVLPPLPPPPTAASSHPVRDVLRSTQINGGFCLPARALMLMSLSSACTVSRRVPACVTPIYPGPVCSRGGGAVWVTGGGGSGGHAENVHGLMFPSQARNGHQKCPHTSARYDRKSVCVCLRAPPSLRVLCQCQLTFSLRSTRCSSRALCLPVAPGHQLRSSLSAHLQPRAEPS